DNTSAAIVLNAGISSAALTSSGGNILLSGTPTVSAASGGRVILYSGSVAGSTGLTELVGSGSGHFRYGSDETTTNYTTALGNGVYAIYREQPTLSITVDNKTITYGDAVPTLTGTTSGTLNGDTSVYSMNGAAYSTANKLKAGSYTLTASGLAELGYNISGGSNGTLSVNTKNLTLAGFDAANKIYDGDNSATINNAGALSGLITGDNVTVSNTGATFDTKNVGTAKTVTLNGLSLGSADSANYTIASTATDTADITPKVLTLSATKTYDGTTSLTGGVSIGGFIGSETLNYTGATASDAHVATGGKYISAMTLVDGSNGGLVGNYALPTLDSANAAVTITAATLTPTLTNSGVTKTYDGTTNASSSFTPTWSFSGLASGDTAASLSNNGASYNDANVLNANKVTVSGLAITAITGSNNSQIGDYVLSAASKNVAATITPAPLTVTANNDAKFVTKTDASGYNGVGYNGFVNGENSSVLGGMLSISRSNAGTESAGIYSGVLHVSGLTADNYQIAYAPGDYTIVPSEQLLVRISNVSDSYGISTNYAISSVEYLDNFNNVVRLDNGSVIGSSASIDGANAVAVDDGAGGTAGFTLSELGSLTSTGGKLKVGNYQIGTSSAVTGSSGNFSNTVTVVGAHQVNAKAISASATGGVSKVYDGTIAMNGVAIGLNGKETNDVVTVGGNGAFSDKNSGTNLSYTISNLALSGDDASNYYLSGGISFSGSDGVITKANATVTANSDTKTYNGTVQSVSGFTATGLVNNETTSVLTGVTTSGGSGTNAGEYTLIASGTDGNYNLTFVDGKLTIAKATITPVTGIVADNVIANIHNASIINVFPVQSFNLGGSGFFEQPLNSASPFMQQILSSVLPADVVDSGSYTIVGIASYNNVYKMVTTDEIQKNLPVGEEIRIPISSNSNVTLIDGGVNLPVGLSQEYYVIDSREKIENN
ncbi:MAG: YDG domain-containing protein, partial [Sulfuricurvum sp.]|nr:YDG domain-containing protein [Sulfuricurvum sp.]